jgi:two-component system sensor histidine kinase GlrK
VLQHVSHELKTPLASLREGIALLDDGVVGTLTGEQREVVDILQHNTRTLQARIEGLLGYNAAMFDARELKRRHFKPRALVDGVIAEQQLTIQTRGLHVMVEGSPPAVHADSDKLHIAITNLVTNAISFSPLRGEIRIVLSCEASMLQIDCIDQGPGARPEEAERIFEPFFQGSRPPPLPRSGSGLGLSIVRAFVAAHGGRVALLPGGPGAGAHFRMELPYGA